MPKTTTNTKNNKTNTPDPAQIAKEVNSLFAVELAAARKDFELFKGFVDVIQNPDEALKTPDGMKEGMRIFRKIERDPHIYSCKQKRINPVLGFPWDVTPGTEGEGFEKAAELIKQILKPRIRRLLKNMLDAIGKGFSVQEIMYEQKDNYVWITEFKQREQHRFLFDMDGNLRLRTEENKKEGIILSPLKFVVHKYEASDANPYGDGLLSKSYYWYWFKNNGVKYFVKFAEKFGAPFGYTNYPQGTPKEIVDTVFMILNNLQNATGIVAPAGFELKFLEAQKTGTVNLYDTLIAMCDTQMSKLWLGATLTTENVQGGSYSLGEVHERILYQLSVGDAEFAEETINEQIIKPVCIFNNISEPYPTLSIKHEKPATKEEMEMILLAARDGIEIEKKDIYKKLGISIPRPGAEIFVPRNMVETPNSGVSTNNIQFGEEPSNWAGLEPAPTSKKKLRDLLNSMKSTDAK